jgi:hypothetical protein
MLSEAADFLETHGVDPCGDVVPAPLARLLRVELEDLEATAVLAVHDPQAETAEQAWRLGDGSLLVRVGAFWLATDPEGRDAEGGPWSVEE